MSLNDLVPEENKTSARSRSTSKTNRHGRKIEKSHPEADFNIGDKEIRINTDTVPPQKCSFCNRGLAVPIEGLSKYGVKYRCHRIFCENGIMKHKREAPEKELTSVRNEMELESKRRGIV